MSREEKINLEEICDSFENNMCELDDKSERVHSETRCHNLMVSPTSTDSNEGFEIIGSEDWELLKTEDYSESPRSLAFTECNIGEKQIDVDVALSSHSSPSTPLEQISNSNLVAVEEIKTSVVEASFNSVEGSFNKMLKIFEGKEIYEAYKSENEVKNIRDDMCEEVYQDNNDKDSLSQLEDNLNKDKKENLSDNEDNVKEDEDNMNEDEDDVNEHEDEVNEDKDDVNEQEDDVNEDKDDVNEDKQDLSEKALLAEEIEGLSETKKEKRHEEDVEKFNEEEKELSGEIEQLINTKSLKKRKNSNIVNPKKDVEIRNVPKIMDDSAEDTFKRIIGSLTLNDDPKHRDQAYFLKYKRSKPFRVIIVPFRNQFYKKQFMEKLPTRKMRAVKIFKDMELAEDTQMIYFNTPISPENRYLMWLARNNGACKSWTVYSKQGKIFAKHKSFKQFQLEIKNKDQVLKLC